ncbi:hypothetical protein [Acrocarpospora macrocephala]|nr:hypothetical protein [Acrocarpospora macrocephala]
MPSEHDESQRAAARGGWPEVPPAWPEVPPASGPTPPGRSFEPPPAADPYGQRPYRTGEHPVLPPPLNDYDQQPRVGRGGTDPFGRPLYRDPQPGQPMEPQPPRDQQPRDFQFREPPPRDPREQQFRDPQPRDPREQQFRDPQPRDPREQFREQPPRDPQFRDPQPLDPQFRNPQPLDPQFRDPQFRDPQSQDRHPREAWQREPEHPAHEPFSTGPFGTPTLGQPAQPAQHGLPGQHGQPGQHLQPGQHGQPGQFEQPGQYEQAPPRHGNRPPEPQQQPGPRDPQTFGMVSPQAFGTGETPLYRADASAPPQAALPQQSPAYTGPQTGEHGVPQFPMAGQRPPQQQHPQGPQHPQAQQHPQGDDQYKPFVTAGQISGPKTPPAHRQQELWNNVFGENYQAIEEYEDEERGRPIWLFALAGSVLIALIGALLWAFLAGPLASSDDAAPSQPSPSPSKASASNASQPQAASLLEYEGTPSPVQGRIADSESRVSIPKLGGQWKTDVDQQKNLATYGYVTRQFVSAGLTTKGKPQFAQVMSGPLAQDLAAKYTTADDLRPVLSAVVFKARQNLFPKGNKVAKVGQQKLRGGIGQLAAYEVSDDGGKTLVVVAAVNTGAPLPSIVYMQVPDIKDDLLPDVGTVFKSIKVANS